MGLCFQLPVPRVKRQEVRWIRFVLLGCRLLRNTGVGDTTAAATDCKLQQQSSSVHRVLNNIRFYNHLMAELLNTSQSKGAASYRRLRRPHVCQLHIKPLIKEQTAPLSSNRVAQAGVTRHSVDQRTDGRLKTRLLPLVSLNKKVE